MAEKKPTVDLKELKKGGVIAEREKGLFSVRLKNNCGVLTSGQLRKLAEVCERYGREFVYVTMRQGVEIPYVRLEDVDAVREELKEVGLEFGPCGPRFRNVTTCACRVCVHHVVDAHGLAEKLSEEFVGADIGKSKKLKVAVSGCVNACPNPVINDMGLVGTVEPELVSDLCTQCGLCVAACKEGALTMGDEGPIRDPKKCIYCGDCIAVCPTGAMRAKRRGYAFYIGGKGGRHPRMAQKVAEFLSDEEVMRAVGNAVELLREEAREGERLAELIDRLGLEEVARRLLDRGKEG